MPRTELWRDIPGWPGYQASDLGRVQSCPRYMADGRWTSGRVLAARPDARGYLRVTLRRDGRSHRVSVHGLVAVAWLGPAPAGKPQVRHLRGQRDNRPGSLAWGNQADQERDKRTAGNRPEARSDEQRVDRKQGAPRAALAVSATGAAS